MNRANKKASSTRDAHTMLKSLSIQNLVIIDQMDIDFQSGLNVLTGETGAGKSILLQAVMMVLGEKIESRIIQAGKDSCQVMAEFVLPALSPTLHALLAEQEISVEENNPTITIRRLLKKDGKSKCWLNDHVIGIGILQHIAPELVEIEAQGQSHRLTKVESHRDLLDDYGKHQPLLHQVATDYQSWQGLLAEQKKMEADMQAANDNRQYLLTAKKELESANIEENELKDLEEKRKALQSAEKTIAQLDEILKLLQDKNGALPQALRASKLLSRLTRPATAEGKTLEQATEQLDQGITLLTNAEENLDRTLRSVESPDWSLADIEERLFALKDLARKYRRPVEELGQYLMEINQQLEGSNQQQLSLTALKADIAAAEKKYQTSAGHLTTARTQAATTLTEKVMAVLPDLKLPHAQFHIEFLPITTPSAKGVEKIQFLCQTNPGQNRDLLHKIASGGELARFLLAIEQAIGAGVDCLIFDEVDSGVGGATADAVGKLLSTLSRQQQCFVITHSPQVAAIGQHHFRVEKVISGNKTSSSVKQLDKTERVMEIARMLSAETITKEAEAQARQLLGF